VGKGLPWRPFPVGGFLWGKGDWKHLKRVFVNSGGKRGQRSPGSRIQLRSFCSRRESFPTEKTKRGLKKGEKKHRKWGANQQNCACLRENGKGTPQNTHPLERQVKEEKKGVDLGGPFTVRPKRGGELKKRGEKAGDPGNGTEKNRGGEGVGGRLSYNRNIGRGPG